MVATMTRNVELKKRILKGLETKLINDLRLSMGTTEHSNIKGENSEVAWANMLRDHLPER